MRTMRIAYNIFAYFAGIFYLIYRFINTKFDFTELRERSGYYPELPVNQSNIWIHCASVGEVNILPPVLRFLKTVENKIVVTTMTESGRENARKKYSGLVNGIFFAPVDFGFAVKNALKRINPGVLIIIETEIWPNLIYYSFTRGTKIILINARISHRAFRWYRALKFFFAPFIQMIDLIITQSEEDRRRFSELKGSNDNIFVAGNLKFDSGIYDTFMSVNKKLLDYFSDKTVIVAGSTHSGEDEEIIKFLPEFFKVIPGLKFIIAPRHLERVNSIEALLQHRGIKFERRSKLDSCEDFNMDVLILDTIGELTFFYRIATLVFVGGTLVPVGGHNVIEPAILKKPVIFGPYYQNFKSACELLLKNGGGICIKDGEELFQKCFNLLNNRALIEEMGRKAVNAIREGMGGTEKTLSLLRNYLGYL